MDSTTAKGNLFEDEVYTLLEKLLSDDELYVNAKRSSIYRKKRYFSESRKSNIIVDISIESSIAGAEDYSKLTIVECKDTKRAVSVDDIEEFDSKIRQIG